MPLGPKSEAVANKNENTGYIQGAYCVSVWWKDRPYVFLVFILFFAVLRIKPRAYAY
jgi:hypothetical protein